MKKSKFMRVAAILMAAVLLTTCAISGTFAKYVTSASATDSARVAKFGVVITATSGSAFSATYATDEAGVSGTIANSVVSANGTDKVIAPGTSGAVTAYSISGTPEVAVNVAYTCTVDLGDGWKDAENNFYCPVEFSVDGGTTWIGQSATNDTAEKLEAAVAAAVAGSANYAANTNLSTATAPALIWRWQFSTSAANDVKDTFLGDTAATGTAATIQVDTTCTVTQID